MARPLHHWTDAVLPAGIDYDAIPSPVPRGASPHRYRRFLGRIFSSFLPPNAMHLPDRWF